MSAPVTVRMISFLHAYRHGRGLPSTVQVEVPESGIALYDLARQLELPLDRVEGAFHNHRSAGLDSVAHPGDRVAFVPYGTPASHPAFFGPFETRR